jgi:predicted transcriptional regulator
MPNHKTNTALVRTSILVTQETNVALRRLAEIGERPLSWEIRRALEDHVERKRDTLEEAAKCPGPNAGPYIVR